MMQDRHPAPRPVALYISHGGGPLPLLGDPGHRELGERLRQAAGRIPRPAGIIVVSAHWEAERATVTSGSAPPLIYDYAGFAPEAYAIRYPAPGDPALAEQVRSALERHGVAAVADAQRGYDHGLFVPLKIMYPDADIPCIQLSLLASLDPAEHLRLGGALAGLARDDLLVLGSGFSFHNMRAFFSPATPESQARNRAFEDWLSDTCANPALDEAERRDRLLHWERAPAARYCHPREEHLLPLHVCYGLAGAPCSEVFRLTILGRQASMYLWSDSRRSAPLS